MSNATQDVTHEQVDEMVARLHVKLVSVFGGKGANRTPVCMETRRLVSIHPVVRRWPLWAKERLEDNAIATYFNELCR